MIHRAKAAPAKAAPLLGAGLICLSLACATPGKVQTSADEAALPPSFDSRLEKRPLTNTISAQSGIGYMTMNAREFLQTDVVLVGILLYALLGKLADMLARTLERLALRWHPGYQATT